jgi:hypothetical protein
MLDAWTGGTCGVRVHDGGVCSTAGGGCNSESEREWVIGCNDDEGDVDCKSDVECEWVMGCGVSMGTGVDKVLARPKKSFCVEVYTKPGLGDPDDVPCEVRIVSLLFVCLRGGGGGKSEGSKYSPWHEGSP